MAYTISELAKVHPSRLFQKEPSQLSYPEAALLLYLIQRARVDFAAFCVLVYPDYQLPYHLEKLCETLTGVESTPDARVIVTMPPRHGKSVSTSVLFPAWWLGRNPTKQIITASYSGGLTASFSARVKSHMNSPAYQAIFPDVKTVGRAASRWSIQKHGGGILASGVTSSMTGYGADCVRASTRIHTPTGYATIESLAQACEAGTKPEVYAYDHASGEIVVRRVIASSWRDTDEIYAITTEGGKEVWATGNHRIFVEGYGYRSVSELVLGDGLLSFQASGKDSISRIILESGEPERVYDIQVEGTGNFFADGVLVHNCLIIDDPIRDAMYADSASWREKVWDWYSQTAYTRLHPGAPVAVIATRWHFDDLSGRLLLQNDDPEADQWNEIYFPAISDSGEALWPERYGVKALHRIRGSIGSRAFEALYQGRPMPSAGGMFQRAWFRKIVSTLPEGKFIYVRYWDKAGTQDGGDWTVGVLMALHIATRRFFVVHVVRGQWSSYEREETIEATAQQDKAMYGTVKIWQEQEPGSGGLQSAQATVKNLAGFSVRSDRPSGSLTLRADPFATQLEAGNVYMVRGDWIQAYVEEFAQFPLGAHDDQVAATAGAFFALTGKRSFRLDVV